MIASQNLIKESQSRLRYMFTEEGATQKTTNTIKNKAKFKFSNSLKKMTTMMRSITYCPTLRKTLWFSPYQQA